MKEFGRIEEDFKKGIEEASFFYFLDILRDILDFVGSDD